MGKLTKDHLIEGRVYKEGTEYEIVDTIHELSDIQVLNSFIKVLKEGSVKTVRNPILAKYRNDLMKVIQDAEKERDGLLKR